MARLGASVFSFAAVLVVWVAGCSGNADDLAAAKAGKKARPAGTTAPPGGDTPIGATQLPGGATTPTTTPTPVPGQLTGSCAPTQVTSLQSTTWRPPNQLRRQLCTQAEATNIVNCYVAGAVASCDQQVTAGCHDCIVTDVNDATWGPLIYDSVRKSIEHNVEGCVAAMSGDITTNGCGARMRIAEQCKAQACAGCTNPAQLPNCKQAAGTTGVCAQYENAAKVCSQQFLATCRPTMDPLQLGLSLARAFCM